MKASMRHNKALRAIVVLVVLLAALVIAGCGDTLLITGGITDDKGVQRWVATDLDTGEIVTFPQAQTGAGRGDCVDDVIYAVVACP